jgi:hypothetical protein
VPRALTNSMGVEKLFEVRLRPGFIEPVSWISGSLANLLGHRFIIRANFLEESVAGSWLWYGYIVLVSESLELRVGPAIHGQ